jgi:tetratricopeptide (TPR) repeat protein
LRKAGWTPFWKRQLKNMAEGSTFIRDLRREWQRQYGARRPFTFLAVAGASDQFVPPTSSLEPFDTALQRVVIGDHVSIVKPATSEAPSVSLVVATLQAGATPAPGPAAELRLAAERPSAKAPLIVEAMETGAREMSVKEIVDAALALDRAGRRAESIALLERHKEKSTDIKGTLGGRLKRLWLESEQVEDGARALALYQEALEGATSPEQIHYLAINVAFMKLLFANDADGARAMATVALEHAAASDRDAWTTATIAEAYLHLGRTSEALAEYQKLLTLKAEPWKHQSASLHAGRIAAKRRDRELAEALEAIFTPGARRVNRIFVSYSRTDAAWLNRLKVMVAPYLRAAETELVLWDDTQLRPGEQCDVQIREALTRAGVAVALVSADFLASNYVMNHELPVLVKAAREGGLRLLWAYISAAGWEETPLREFQATHDPSVPLDARPKPEQDQILKSIAQQMKEAALGATGRFKHLPI